MVGDRPSRGQLHANNTNSAKNSVATFTAAGTYVFQALITNSAVGTSVVSTVTITVNQTPTSHVIFPGTIIMAAGASMQFAAGEADQFGQIIYSLSATWSVSNGGGSINSGGVYTAATTGGSSTIKAVFADSSSATETITVAAPIAWYKADSPSGTTLIDSSGQGKNGQLNGTTSFTAGVSANALTLSGGYASLPQNIVSSLTNFTISAWVDLSTLAYWDRIFDFGTGTNNYMFLTPYAGGTSALRFAILASGGSTEQQLNGPAITTNTWTHIAITLSGSVGTLYVNGSTVATNFSMTWSPSSLGTTNQNFLGKSQFSADPAYSGSIDDFRIYGQALSPSQVMALAAPVFLISPKAVNNPVIGKTTSLSASATDLTAGATSLIYTWSAMGNNPGTISFSANSTNSSQSTTATFTAAGTYNVLLTVDNPLAGIVTTAPSRLWSSRE